MSQTITVPTVGANQGLTAVQNYNYDELNRLKDAKENINGNPTPSWKQTFTFDRYGNRRFDAANTTTIDPNTNKLIGYTFDTAGNTAVDATGRTFTYDAENKQTKVVNSNNITVGEYFYDGDGKRVKKVVGTEVTIFVYDASGKMVAEYSTTVAPVSQAKVSYLTTDHLGSPRINTDAGGQVTARHDYQPFGEEIQRASYGNDDIREQFATYERDEETDLDFAQARYFNSGFGRFSSTDPLQASGVANEPQSWNRYIYTFNNPLKFIDPTGEITSTHTDKDGNVYAVYDDGDLGVYKHNDLDGVDGKHVEVKSGQKTVEKMGETEYWDEFRGHDNEGTILSSVADGAKIRFDTSFDGTINTKVNEASSMSLSERAKELKTNGKFDIKNDKKSFDSPNEGRLLNGKYATARSAGNYLAGYLGATGKEYGVHISEKTFMKLSGALHQGKYSTKNVAKILAFGTSFGSAPYYGEIEYAGRRISAGFRDGVQSLDSRNVTNHPRY